MITRREAVHAVAALLGGAALHGGDQLLAFSFDEGALEQAIANGVGAFTAADVALLDEIAETILPETSTPGAKAAKTGAFMALAASDVYTAENHAIFKDGLRKVDEACASAHATSFMTATPAQRLAVLEGLDREQKAAMDAQRASQSLPRRSDSEGGRPYFRLMKELALLGYFTSEIGSTRAMRYIESPGRFDPCAPHTPGDRSWAPHA